jgi:hypothetical protein
MSLIITRGFGESDGIIIEYVPVPICKPEMTANEWGKKSMEVEPCVIVVSECE